MKRSNLLIFLLILIGLGGAAFGFFSKGIGRKDRDKSVTFEVANSEALHGYIERHMDMVIPILVTNHNSTPIRLVGETTC